jgi:hypothetical protein
VKKRWRGKAQLVSAWSRRRSRISKSTHDCNTIGSTCLTGSFLIRQLLADPSITKVIAVSRKSLNISSAKLTRVSVSDLAELPSIELRIRG